MNEPQPKQEAADAVRKMLEVLQVLRVVCVDDYYDDEPQIEPIMVDALSLDAGRLQELFPELGARIPEDRDVLKARIRQVWNELEQAIRLDRAKAISSAAGNSSEADADDRLAASALGSLIPQEILLTLTQRQWIQRRSQLLQKDAECRTLFLFDQDLSKKGGEVDGGMRIIASLLASEDSENLICGLLTHTVSPENQSEKWVEFSESYSISSRDRFLIIPKRYLSEDQMLFAQSLKWVALSPDFATLKKKTKKILQDAAEKAAERVEAISIYDLEHMVFKVSEDEGLWEPDMLFRLHALFHRLESRQLAFEGGELEEIAKRLRSVSNVPTTANLRPVSSTWKIQKDERYEPGDYLSQNNLPLELGDIFVKSDTPNQKAYILLAPPCSLMVRSGGKRGPEIEHVPLAEIVIAKENSVPKQCEERIQYFGDESGKDWIVKLNRVHHVRVWLLDLCVFNPDGKATMILDGDAPNATRPAWKKRYAVVTKSVRQLLNRVDSLFPSAQESKDVVNLKTRLRSELMDSLLKENLFKGELLNQDGRKGIAYNCRRIGRLSRTHAFGLLMAYTSCLSRPAYERDFVKSED